MKTNKKVTLPKVSFESRTGTSKDYFWLHQANSGTIDAFRQLSSTRYKGSRKYAPLPGGKLQPLYKNYTSNADRGDATKYGTRTVLPGIEDKELSRSRLGHMSQVLTGDLNELPTQDPTLVRVYLASSLTAMKEERDVIMHQAVPEIQKFCSEYGLTFQLVDWNWARPKQSTGFQNHLIRHAEIQTCKQLSLGPTFVVLASDMYDPLELPLTLNEVDFMSLSQVLLDFKLDAGNMLKTWYQKDETFQPPLYRLMNFEDEQKQKITDFLETVMASTNENTLPFLTSAFERDVKEGAFDMKDPRNHCLCYQREWQQISEHITHPAAATYINTSKSEDGQVTLNEKKFKQQRNLTKQLAQYLGVANNKVYYIPWPAKSEDEPTKTKEYLAYIQNFVDNFVTDMKQLISQGIERLGKGSTLQKSTMKEVLYHSQMCLQKAEYFHGQSEILFGVEKFLKDPRQTHMPYIIHGAMGCGLSSLMAHITTLIPQWFSSDAVTVLRFLGTTSDCNSIHQLLVSIIMQICLAYDLQPPDMRQDLDTLFKTIKKFRSTLETVSREFAGTRPLFILLDGIHKLQPVDESIRALWGIKDFPPNVRVIITLLSHVGQVNILENVISMLTATSAVAEVKPLTDESVSAVIDDHFRGLNKSTDAKQKDLIINKYKEGGESAVHLNLLITRCLNSSLASGEQLPNTVSAYFEEVINSLEQKFGEDVIRYLLSHITIALVGIQERELLDLASCSYDVNMQLRKYLDTEDVVYHIPSWIWCDIKFAINIFIEERLYCGTVVLGWKQAEYYIIIAKRYGTVLPGIPEDFISNLGTAFTLGLHEDIIDRYLERPPSFDEELIDTCAEENKILYLNQPTSVSNLRKLSKLPHHMYVLIPVVGLQDIKEQVFFNFTWLLAKIQTTGLSQLCKELLQTMELGKSIVEENTAGEESTEDMQLLYECLQRLPLVQAKDVIPVAQELVCRLMDLQVKYPAIRILVGQIEAYIAEKQVGALLPLYTCITPPGAMLRHTLPGATHLVGLSPDGSIAVTFNNSVGVDVWSLESGEKLQHYPVHKEQSFEGIILTSTGDFVIKGYYSHLNHSMELSVWSTITGLCLVKSSYPNKFEAFALDPSNKFIMIATTMPHKDADGNKASEINQRCLIGVESKTRNILYTIQVINVHKEGVAKMEFVKGIHGGLNGLVTLGSKFSKDLAYWDLESEQLKYQVQFEHSPDMFKINSVKKMAVCANSSTGVIYTVSLTAGEITNTFTNESWKNMVDLYVSNNGDHMLIATQSAGVSVFSTLSKSEVKTLKPSKSQARPSRVTMDSSEFFAIVSYSDGLIEIYLTASCQSLLAVQQEPGATNTLLYHSGYILSAGENGVCHMFQLLPELEKNLQQIHEATLSTWDGWVQFEVVSDDIIKTKVSNDTEESATCQTEDSTLSAVLVMPNDKYVITASRLSKIKLYDLQTGNLQKEIMTSGIDQIYLASRNSLIMAHVMQPQSNKLKKLQMWKVETGALLKFDDESSIPIYCSCTLADDNYIFTVSPEKDPHSPDVQLGVFDLFELKWATTRPCRILGRVSSETVRPLGSVSLARPAAVVVTDSSDGTILRTDSPAMVKATYVLLQVVDCRGVASFYTFTVSGTDEVSIAEHSQPMLINTAGPRATTLLMSGKAVSGDTDGSLNLWDITICSMEGEFVDSSLGSISKLGKKNDIMRQKAHSSAVSCVVSTKLGHTIASGDNHGIIKVWNVADLSLRNICSHHTKEVSCLQFSSDGTLLVSGAADQVVCVWRWQSSSCLATFNTHDDILDLHISAASDRVIIQLLNNSPTLHLLRLCNIV